MEFINNSTNATEYSWILGNGSFSTEESPSATYNGPAQYNIYLTATNPNSCNISDQDTLVITVSANDFVESIFELNQINCENLTVQGISSSEGHFLDLFWDMGDGTELEGDTVLHDYELPGFYNVELTVEDNICGVTGTSEEEIEVTEEVIADIDFLELNGCAPFTFDLNSTSTGGDIYTWELGDGSDLVEGETVNHTYSDGGTYTITLTVEGNSGCFGQDQAQTTVEVVEPPELSPNFSLERIGDCEDLTYSFTNLSEGPIDNYSWEFGDGNVSISENPNNTFNSIGTYTILLTVSEDQCGVEEAFSDELEITPDPPFSLGEDIITCYTNPVGFINATFEGDNVSYQWSNGSDSPVIEVTETGNYSVEVDADGCIYADNVTFTIIEELDLDKTQFLCSGSPHQIAIPYIGGTNHYWVTTNDSDIETTIEEDGLYEYTFTDPYGCDQSGFIDVVLEGTEPTMYIPNAFTPNGDGLNDVFLPVNGNLDDYSLAVFNRWGQVVFQTTDPTEPWTGNTNEGVGKGDHFINGGVYTYEIEYSSKCNTQTEEYVGQITVVR